ncbi:MAG: peptidase S10, partial [Chloroflexota bacterium]
MSEQNETAEMKKDEKKEAPKFEEKRVVTQHEIKLNGKKLSYTAVAGTIVLHDEEDKKAPQPKGEIFYIAYTLNSSKKNEKRPITFSFNGGPGSSSVWMHLGLLGPKRVPMSDDNNELIRPPYEVEDNEYSILDQTDLVFIDPVGTGFSRAVEGIEGQEFWNFTKDIESVGEFIRLYTTREQRWSSPKFFIGESYGTTRAAGLSG